MTGRSAAAEEEEEEADMARPQQPRPCVAVGGASALRRGGGSRGEPSCRGVGVCAGSGAGSVGSRGLSGWLFCSSLLKTKPISLHGAVF